MTQEEKAKAYDEALERAKEQLEGAKVFDYKEEQIAHDIRTTTYVIFPELKESEDEKTRKRIIALVNAHGQDMYKDDMLAWLKNIPYTIDHEKREGFHLGYKAGLEKQGEHKKFRDSIQVGDEVTRNSDGVIVNLPQLKRVAKKSEQKLPIEKLPSEMKTIRESLGFTTQEECDEYNEMVTNLIMGDDDKGEQKSAWSEEDERNFNDTILFIETALKYALENLI